MVKRIFLLIIAVWLMLIILAPKERIYYLLEHRLSQWGIVLSGEKLHWKPFGLKITDAELYAQGIRIGKLPEADFWTLLFYSELDTGPFLLSPDIQKILDLKLSKARLVHKLWHPETVFIEAEGNFGHISGRIDLQSRKISLRLTAPGEPGVLKRYFRKDKKGWYYERTF